jgi:transcriptional regulator
MYQPAHGKFVESHPEQLRQLIRRYPLGTLITRQNGEIKVDHTPFLLDTSRSDLLTAHVPRANPVWQGLEGQSATIVFHGPNAYISPSWYPSKHAHGKVVPTWNYAVVHVQGTVRVMHDAAWLTEHIDKLTDEHEQTFARTWKVSDAPTEYIDNLLKAIVGLEVSVTHIEGKFKLGQSRPEADRMGVEAGLASIQSPLADFAGALMRASTKS